MRRAFSRPAASFGVSPFAALAAALGAVLLALVAGAALAQSAPPSSSADPRRDDGLVRQDQMEGGALLLRTDEPGLYAPAPILKTVIDVAVAGPIARAVVTQRFQNPAQVFVEGKYIFPLPENAAVDTLKMRIGDRLIEGEVKEREEAKEIYETAKAEGFKASLVEQERPNLFTTSVANIGPGETVVIQIEYQETLAPRDGAFGLRVPLVVAPRYVAEPRIDTVKFGPNGWELVADVPVPDADRISAPIVDPRDDAEAGTVRNPVELTVSLDAGFPLGPIRSPYHKVAIDPAGPTGARVRVEGPVSADRDFYLSWRPARLSEPYLAVFTEQKDAARHYLMMLTPPAVEEIGAERKPREVIFVQDVSGSMAGESIEQAKKGLEMAVRRLRPEDRFNLIVFNDKYGQLFDAPVAATPEHLDRAVRAVRALEADGGTEMLPALEAALLDDAPEDADRIRQVVFLTDGAVGAEREMLRLIERDLGRSRLFTVGIGSAPNSYFMVRAAETGRGSFVFIGDLGEVRERMEQLFAKIETPALTDLSLSVEGWSSAESWPNPLPDLYAGDPVVATVRVAESSRDAAEPALTVSAAGGAAWGRRVPLSEAVERAGVSKLWARQRIRALEALSLSPDVDQQGREAIDAEILGTALTHGLVSRLTSLVAVDVTPTRPVDAPLVTRETPLALPKGWDPAVFFDAPSEGATYGPTPKPAAGPDQEPPLLKAEALRRLAAAAAQRDVAQAAGAPLPVGSTDWALPTLLGLALLTLALLVSRGGGRPAARPSTRR